MAVGQIGARRGRGENVVGEGVLVRHDLADHDGIAIEAIASLKLVEGSAVGGRVGGADVEHGAARGHEVNHVMTGHGPAHDLEQGYRQQRPFVLAVDEIARPQLGDGAIACGVAIGVSGQAHLPPMQVNKPSAGLASTQVCAPCSRGWHTWATGLSPTLSRPATLHPRAGPAGGPQLPDTP